VAEIPGALAVALIVVDPLPLVAAVVGAVQAAFLGFDQA
jgi:hypothetical protein